MRIVKGRPPNYDAIAAALPAAARSGIIFCYGDAIYVGPGTELPAWLIAHEGVHSARQGADPAAWWNRYIADPQFRFAEELPAHRMEWMVWLKSAHRNRHDKRAMLKIIAGRLSGSLYGKIVSLDVARGLVLNEKGQELAA